jgi:CubicO group peptidase (beta-lactamase class C family)
MTPTRVRIKAVAAGLIAAAASMWGMAALAQPQAGTLDPVAVQRWSDAYFQDAMAHSHAPGAVMVVVDHGRVVLLKGYGVTTPVGGHPIDPDTTLFRLGSITKVLTAITASQLIEEGRIDPALDVNHYLKRIQVPATYRQPVTLADLLAHEGGFGADLRGVDAPTNAQANIAPAEMQRLLVPRVRPPGRYIAYDNNGWGVLGLTLADATGEPYAQLIRERVFQPLGMSHAVIGVPDADSDRVIGEHYVMPDGSVRRIDHSLLKPMEQGAGDGSATGSDMARLMIALLQGGEIDGKRVLSPAGYQSLTNFNAHRLHPMLPGYGRALYEDRPLGHFAIRHDGGMAGSASSMELYPHEQIGVFFAINARPYNPFDGETLSGLLRGIRMFLFDPKPKVSMDDYQSFRKIHDVFAGKFLPPAGPEIVDTRGVRTLTDQDLAGLAGKYLPTNAPFSSFVGNLQVAAIEGIHVAPAGHGAININGRVFRQIYPGLFENPESKDRMAFHTDVTGTFIGPAALWIDKRVAGYETPVLTVLPLVFLPFSMLLAGFYAFSKRPLYRQLGLAAAGLAAVYFVCLVLEGQFTSGNLVAGRQWLSALWRLVLHLDLLGLVAWPVVLIRGWLTAPPARTVRGVTAALHLSLVGLSGLALVLLAAYWKLIGHI